MEEVFVAESGRLIASAIIGIVVLILLIVKFKLHPILSMMISAILIGIGAGMPVELVLSTIEKGVGQTLQRIALLVGLGSMFGAILEVSGGATQLAQTLINTFGEKKAGWALGLTGLIIGMTVFFEAGVVVLIPLAFSIAQKTKKSTLSYAIPLLGGLASGYAFIPPSAGAVLVSSMLGVDLGTMIAVGAPIGLVTMIVAGIIWGSFIGDKIHTDLPIEFESVTTTSFEKLPSFSTVLAIVSTPLLLILISTVSGYISFLEPIYPVLLFIGNPFVSLTIATLLAMYLLGARNGYNGAELKSIMDKSLRPTGMILLVIACGGVIRWMLQTAGLGEIIGPMFVKTGFPLVVIAFLIAAVVRASVGSTIVAMTMSAGIMATMPEIVGLSTVYLAAMSCAICGGATAFSHVNDSGFWLVKSYLEIDEKTAFKSWTIMETIIGFTGLALAFLISLFA